MLKPNYLLTYLRCKRTGYLESSFGSGIDLGDGENVVPIDKFSLLNAGIHKHAFIRKETFRYSLRDMF